MVKVVIIFPQNETLYYLWNNSLILSQGKLKKKKTFRISNMEYFKTSSLKHKTEVAFWDHFTKSILL